VPILRSDIVDKFRPILIRRFYCDLVMIRDSHPFNRCLILFL